MKLPTPTQVFERLRNAASERARVVHLTRAETASAAGLIKYLRARGESALPVLNVDAMTLDISTMDPSSLRESLVYLEGILRARTGRAVAQGRTGWGAWAPHSALATKLRIHLGMGG